MTEPAVITRLDYFAALERHRLTPDLIKMVTGVRRCGKSTILKMYRDKLRSEGIKDEFIVAIDLEDFANKNLWNGAKLHEYVLNRCKKNKRYYVFIDEIQLVCDFGEVINSLRLRKNIDVYVTGSNSSLLSSRLPKILGGRYIQIHMFPLSFREYVSGHPPKFKVFKDALFQNYLENSSFPEVFAYSKLRTASLADLDGSKPRIQPYVNHWDRQGVREYLAHIYESIIMRDVMQRDDVKELPQLTRVVHFLFSNIGSETSINNMLGIINNEFKLKPNDKNLYAPMLERYLAALLDCFIFYKADKQHLSGKELLRTNAKYYAVDAGLRYYLLGGTAGVDTGHILENIVYLELLRRGYKVTVGKIGDREIDFAAYKPGGHAEYFQVAQSVTDEKTLMRELEPLQMIKDNHPKFLLTRDNDRVNFKGIQHVNVLEWLLGKK